MSDQMLAEEPLETPEQLVARLRAERDSERERRIYYQDIVYHTCNWIDYQRGYKPGAGVVCGTAQQPATGVQDALAEMAAARVKERDDALVGEAVALMARAGPLRVWYYAGNPSEWNVDVTVLFKHALRRKTVTMGGATLRIALRRLVGAVQGMAPS